jgi:tol-pal system protein YbgF
MMMNRWCVTAGAALVLLLTGCATESKEFMNLKEEVKLQQKQIIDLRARQEDQQTKLEILDNGFKLMGDKVDENSRTIDDLGRGAGMPSITSPVAVPAARKAPVSPPPPVSLPARQPISSEPVVVQPKLSAADLYRSALASFTEEDYQGSILRFEEFVANYPEHDLADNAQYWIGECYYAQKNFDQAVAEFGKVGTHFSSGNKAPAALLKKGLALKEAGKGQDAAAVLGQVVSQYPGSDEASIAENKLSQWQ